MRTPLEPGFHLELDALYARYASLLDEGPLADWPGLFFENGSYKAVTRENVDRNWPLALILCESRAAIEDRVYAIENLSLTIPRRIRHIYSGLTAAAATTDSWSASANFAIFETVEGQQTVCFSAGRYHDIVARDEDGELKFRQKVAMCDSALIRNSLVFPL